MVWFVIKTECKQNIQKKATAWFLSGWEVNYKKRLPAIKLLFLSYNFELHDLPKLITLLQGNYNIELQNKLNENAMNT